MKIRTRQALLQAATAVAAVCAAAAIFLPAASFAAPVTTAIGIPAPQSPAVHPVVKISSTRIR